MNKTRLTRRTQHDYQTLAAGMRQKPDFAGAEEAMKKTKARIKGPDDMYINLWNSPSLLQFRGIQEEIDETEERLHRMRLREEDIRNTAHQEGINTVDLTHISQALTQQDRRMSAMQQHQQDLASSTQRQQQAMQEEMRAHMTALAAEQRHASERARMAEEVGKVHVDTLMADRDRLMAVA